MVVAALDTMRYDARLYRVEVLLMLLLLLLLLLRLLHNEVGDSTRRSMEEGKAIVGDREGQLLIVDLVQRLEVDLVYRQEEDTLEEVIAFMPLLLGDQQLLLFLLENQR